MENAEIVRQLGHVADLLELENANPFRVRAYRRAARTLESLAEPVAELARRGPEALTDLPGIGEDLAGKIVELAQTGELSQIRELEARVPAGLSELLRLRGLGPKRVRALWEQLGITSLAGLIRALEGGRVRKVAGFGPGLERKLRSEIERHQATGSRMLRATAAEYGEALLAYLKAFPGVREAEIAGSYRRCRETVGDLDILVSCRSAAPVIRRFVEYPEVAQVLEEGPQRASVRLASGLQVDVRIAAAQAYGASLYYFTGSKAHNIAVRRLGQRRGLKINEYGVFRGARRIAGRTEKEVLASVGLPWIPPELREDQGEIDAAAARRLPRLVTLDDVIADLQMHTTSSDGRDDLETMVEAARARGYGYVAITDHSPAVRIVKGLDRRGFLAQRRALDRLNERLSPFRVLWGAEVDILADGRLDLDDRTLADLELVTVAVHSKFDLPLAEQTRRIVRALQHPDVDILAHPSGRLIGERSPMELDWDAVFAAALEHGVMLEINAQPTRLDLDEVTARRAIQAGLRVVVSTDAHSAAELGFMRWGVDQARRAWATAADVANTATLTAFERRLHRAR